MLVKPTYPTETDFVLQRIKRTESGPTRLLDSIPLAKAIMATFDTLDVRFSEEFGMHVVRHPTIPFVFDQWNHDLPFLSAHDDNLLIFYSDTLATLPVKIIVFDDNFTSYTNGILHNESRTFFSTDVYLATRMEVFPIEFIEHDYVEGADGV